MNFDKAKIRKWKEKDFKQVYNLLKDSWKAAYSSFIPKEDLDFYLAETYNLNKLSKLFHNKNIICFTAEVEKSVAGWLKLTIDKEENRFYLSSIYVLPEYQKLKIGTQLMDFAFTAAKDKGFSEIWIGVMQNNTRVLQWYKKLEFEFIEALPFTMGKTTVNHLIGVKKLN